MSVPCVYSRVVFHSICHKIKTRPRLDCALPWLKSGAFCLAVLLVKNLAAVIRRRMVGRETPKWR